MSWVTLGVVSNAWASLLPDSSLVEQCRRAVSAGYGYVELRQGALGECEESVPGEARPWPVAERLAELKRQVPELGFNLAVETPFLTRVVNPESAYLRRCAEAARALGGDPPVLRLVDVSPVEALLEHEEAIDELGHGAAELARHLWRRGVRLALENSKQPVEPLRAVLRRAAFGLPEATPAPQLCWDPANQVLQQLQAEDPVQTARALGADELFEFHFKQVSGAEVLPDVRGGDLDWPAICAALQSSGYHGPALFEIAPGPDIWERLDSSSAFIRGVLGAIDKASA
jgi:sugar phosphate isomerase/epimerase